MSFHVIDIVYAFLNQSDSGKFNIYYDMFTYDEI